MIELGIMMNLMISGCHRVKILKFNFYQIYCGLKTCSQSKNTLNLKFDLY